MLQAKDGTIDDRALVRPDRNNWGPRLGLVSNYFNRGAVVIPSGSSPFGSVGRNTIRSDGFYQLDLAASRKFNLPREEMNLQFRAEFFNLFNKTNFLAPNANRSAVAFGAITSTYDPRLIQLGLKLNF